MNWSLTVDLGFVKNPGSGIATEKGSALKRRLLFGPSLFYSCISRSI